MKDLVKIEDRHIPYSFTKKIMTGQKGGLFLVFVNGKTLYEINNKIKRIKQFIRQEIKS